jgi:hypothetical protein
VSYSSADLGSLVPKTDTNLNRLKPLNSLSGLHLSRGVTARPLDWTSLLIQLADEADWSHDAS